jgi:hypothetical protein
MKKQLRKLCRLGNGMVESPTLMDRWRITVLGKPVLSLPIKEPSEYPSKIDLKVHTAAGKEREIDFQRVLCRGFQLDFRSVQEGW